MNINNLKSEFEKELEKFIIRRNKKQEILDSQIDRFQEKCLKNPEFFEEFINKVENKYSSKEYLERWYKRNIEPPETLKWFLYEYVKAYGLEISHDSQEWENHANTFTSELFYIHGYYFNRMDGQGSIIKIQKGINMNLIHDPLALPFFIKGREVRKFEDIEEFHIDEKYKSIKISKGNFWKISSFNRALKLSKIYRQFFSMDLLDKYFTEDVHEQIHEVLQPSDFFLFENLSDFIDNALNNKIKLTWSRK